MDAWLNSDWSNSIGEKGNVFHLIHDDAKPEAAKRLLPVGSTYEVALTVDAVKSRGRPGESECEKLFGIIPSKFTKTSPEGHSKGYVRVAAIIPGSEAYKSRIDLNDWLMCVNDLEVTWDNLNSILSAVTSPKQIRLTLQQMISDNKMVLMSRKQTTQSNLVRPVLRPGEELPDDTHQHLTVMYMTLDSSADSNTNDLLYCYPSDTRDSNKLVTVRGMFLTLSNVMSDISNNPAQISSVLCEGELVHVSYTQNGRQLLIIAAPADKVTAQHLLCIMENSTRCLGYMFSSLHCALAERDNLQRVDLFFTLLSQLLLSSQRDAAQDLSTFYIRSALERSYDTVNLSPVCIQLPDEAKMNVDNALSEFEAADFGDMSDDFYDMRRAYTIMGTSLFYKGYLVANHLPTEDMIDMALYASHYNILAVSRLSPIGSSIIWQEVFPTRRKPLVSPEQADPFYIEASGRYFLLIVAYRHSVLGVLLEAGGCSARAMEMPAADMFYVNQARQTLRQLEAFDFSLICEARLQTSRPPLNSIDNLQQSLGNKTNAPVTIAKGIFARAGNTAADLMKRASAGTSKVKSAGKQSIDLNASHTSFMASLDKAAAADVDNQSYGSGSSPPHTPSSENTGFRRSRNMSMASTGSADSSGSVNQLYNSTRLGRAGRGDKTISPGRESNSDIHSLSTTTSLQQHRHNSFILTSGEENTLFNYISYDSVLGVILSPTIDELLVNDSEEHRQLLDNFYSTCISIRCLFQQSLDSKEADISSVYEHGVLFNSTPSNPAKKSHCYWVIGRCFTKPTRREFFVCHHDSVSESMVELSFKASAATMM